MYVGNPGDVPTIGTRAVLVSSRNQPDELTYAVVKAVGPDALQLHGDESPDRAVDIRRRWDLPIIKAIKVATANDARQALNYRAMVDYILFDASPPEGATRPGGHGTAQARVLV